jgi:CRISPR/Cas system-associated endoribonuclease Cas2
MQAAIDPEINPVIQNFIEQTINGEFAFVFNLKEMHNHVEQYMKFHAFYVSNQEQQEMYFAVITPYNFSDNVFFNVNGSTNCLVVSFNNEEKSLFVGDLSDWGESNDLLRLKGETLKGIFETEEDTIQIKRFEHNDAFVAEVVEPVNPDQTKHKDTPPIKHEGPIERENQHNPARRKKKQKREGSTRESEGSTPESEGSKRESEDSTPESPTRNDKPKRKVRGRPSPKRNNSKKPRIQSEQENISPKKAKVQPAKEGTETSTGPRMSSRNRKETERYTPNFGMLL